MKPLSVLSLCWILVGGAGPGADQFALKEDGFATLRVHAAQDQPAIGSAMEFPSAPSADHSDLLSMSPLPEAPPMPRPMGCGILVNEGLPRVTASLGSVMRSASLVESALDAETRVFTFHLHEPTVVWWEVER